MKERVLNVLQEIRPDVDFEQETGLVSEGVLGHARLLAHRLEALAEGLDEGGVFIHLAHHLVYAQFKQVAVYIRSAFRAFLVHVLRPIHQAVATSEVVSFCRVLVIARVSSVTILRERLSAHLRSVVLDGYLGRVSHRAPHSSCRNQGTRLG